MLVHSYGAALLILLKSNVLQATSVEPTRTYTINKLESPVVRIMTPKELEEKERQEEQIKREKVLPTQLAKGQVFIATALSSLGFAEQDRENIDKFMQNAVKTQDPSLLRHGDTEEAAFERKDLMAGRVLKEEETRPIFVLGIDLRKISTSFIEKPLLAALTCMKFWRVSDSILTSKKFLRKIEVVDKIADEVIFWSLDSAQLMVEFAILLAAELRKEQPPLLFHGGMAMSTRYTLLTQGITFRKRALFTDATVFAVRAEKPAGTNRILVQKQLIEFAKKTEAYAVAHFPHHYKVTYTCRIQIQTDLITKKQKEKEICHRGKFYDLILYDNDKVEHIRDEGKHT